jgi:hypothetical protein
MHSLARRRKKKYRVQMFVSCPGIACRTRPGKDEEDSGVEALTRRRRDRWASPFQPARDK